MKTTLSALALILCASLFSQTVPNGDFESWESTPQFTYDPVGWQTDNSQLVVSTYPDEESYQGQYAMRVTPIPNGIGEYGEASMSINMGGLPDGGLSFYAKWSRTPTAAVGVSMEFYNGEDLMHNESWYPGDTASAWTPVFISLPPIDVALTHGVIRVFVAIGDFAPGTGWLSVDAMDFGMSTSEEELSFEEVKLFPNPASDRLDIDIKSPTHYEIIDDIGRTIIRGETVGQIDVQELPEGRYALLLSTSVGLKTSKSFVVQR